MFLFVAFLSVLPLLQAYNATNSVGYPICSENIYLGNGQLDIDSTLYNCSANINGALIIPSYIPKPNGDYSPVNVSLAVKINSLIEVEDISSSVTMGFFLRLQWHDERWYMPGLYEKISIQATHEGLDITSYVYSQNPLNIWLPDIVFYEGTEMTVLAEFIRLFPDGKVYWSRNLQVTVQESQNLIYEYPNDGQNFSLTFQSYSYETQFLNLKFMNPPVVFRYNAEYQKNAVELNQLWTYKDYTAFVANVASPAVFNPNRQYSSAYVNLKFQRQSFGVVFRLALPVCMFMLIVGFSFWTDIEKRLEVTVEMLLTVTALYLVIGTVIPFVGYLTVMDDFMSCVFILLSLVIGVHVICLKLDRSSEDHPMANFIQDMIVLFFRVVWLPCTIAVFQFFFSVSAAIVQVAFYGTCIACAAQLLLSLEGIEDSFRTSLINLRKLEDEIHEEHSKRDSGKLKGHDIHLVRQLDFSERFILYVTRCCYKNKHSGKLELESLHDHQDRQTADTKDEVKHDGYEEESKEAATAASASQIGGVELADYNNLTVNTVDYAPQTYHRVNSGGSNAVGAGVYDRGESPRSYGSAYLAASLAGANQRDSFRGSSRNSHYVEASHYNGPGTGYSSRGHSPRYPSSSFRDGPGSARFSDRTSNSAYGDSYYNYGGRESGY